jgi:hypothetical protein
MKWLRHVLFYIAAGVVLAATLAEIGMFIANVRTRRKAETLLFAIRQLRLGESTLSSTQKLRIDYGASINDNAAITGSAPEQLYTITLSNGTLSAASFTFPRLWRLGLKPWAVRVELRYREEKLVFLRYLVGTPVLTASGEPIELVAETSVRADRSLEQHRNYGVGYFMRPSSIATKASELHFGAVLTPEATQDERDTAFDFDLSCLSTFRGCQAACEIMPSVWREAKRRNENKEISLPDELLENARCSAHYGG